jgi:NUP50 (Nucleoporin 50 kDa)
MVKRGNDNQLTKDDYESEVSSRAGRGDGPAMTQGYERAPASVVSQRRRIVTAKRPKADDPSTASSAADAEAAAPNPFAKINLAQPTTMSFDFTKTQTPAAAPESFSFGGSSTTTTATSGRPPAPPGWNTKFQNHARALEDCLVEECVAIDPKTTLMLDKVDQYLDFVNVVEDEYWLRMPRQPTDFWKPGKWRSDNDTNTNNNEDDDDYAKANAKANSDQAPPTPSEDSKPAASSFLSFTSAAAPTPTLGSSFGSNSWAAPTTTAAAASSTTFSFLAAPKTDGTAVVTSFAPVAPAVKDTTAAADAVPEGNENLDLQHNNDLLPSLQQGDADMDWNDLAVLEGTVHVYVGAANKAKGPLKIQQHVKTLKKRIIMRDPNVGRVLVNMQLPDSMSFMNQSTKKYAAGIESANCMGILTPDDQDQQPQLIRLRRPMQKPSMEESFIQAGVKKV